MMEGHYSIEIIRARHPFECKGFDKADREDAQAAGLSKLFTRYLTVAEIVLCVVL